MRGTAEFIALASERGRCGGTGSRLFEINTWMWRYGRTFRCQISVVQAVEFRKKRVQESRAPSRGAETLRRWRDAAWAKGASRVRSAVNDIG
jgi:hypothetical protein